VIVSLAAYNRPRYLAEVLDAFDEAVYWLARELNEPTFLVASVDPSEHTLEIEQMLAARQPGVYVYVNDEQKGCSGNTLLAVERAFKVAERVGESYVQHLEDDFVFAPDALLLSRWIRDRFEYEPAVLCGGVSTAHAATPDEHLQVHLSDWFHCQGWSTWRDRWEKRLKPTWQVGLGEVDRRGWAQNFNDRSFHVMPASWDTHLDMVATNGVGKQPTERLGPSKNGKLYQAIPRLTRVKHIGLEGGVHTTPETFERDAPKVFAGDVLTPPYSTHYEDISSLVTSSRP